MGLSSSLEESTKTAVTMLVEAAHGNGSDDESSDDGGDGFENAVLVVDGDDCDDDILGGRHHSRRCRRPTIGNPRRRDIRIAIITILAVVHVVNGLMTIGV